MQTFLPFADFEETARVLDNARLGKQRVEGMQVLNALRRTSGGWINHPAVRMWRGYEDALRLYTITICEEWVRRSFADTVREKVLEGCPAPPEPGEVALPPWLGDPALHRSHQSNLIRKDPAYYGPRFPGVPPDLPYVWPTVPESSG